MSASTQHQAGAAGAHQNHGARSEDDRVATGMVVKIGLGALLVFFIGSVAAVSYLRARQAESGPQGIPAQVGQSKIGLVEQQQFDLVARGERLRAAQRKRLASAGWVDQQAGIAHIPIDEAMKLVAQGVRAPAGGQP